MSTRLALLPSVALCFYPCAYLCHCLCMYPLRVSLYVQGPVCLCVSASLSRSARLAFRLRRRVLPSPPPSPSLARSLFFPILFSRFLCLAMSTSHPTPALPRTRRYAAVPNASSRSRCLHPRSSTVVSPCHAAVPCCHAVLPCRLARPPASLQCVHHVARGQVRVHVGRDVQHLPGQRTR